jgi:hypothetical protein
MMAHSVIRMARSANEVRSAVCYHQTRKGAMDVNSYLNLILDTKDATERLRQVFRSAPQPEANERLLSSIVFRNQRQKRKGKCLVRPTATSPCGGLNRHAARECWATQLGGVSIDASTWIVSCVLAIVGLIKAVCSEEPLLWIAIWPAPVVLASTIFIFLRQGFHFRKGMLVLGRVSQRTTANGNERQRIRH